MPAKIEANSPEFPASHAGAAGGRRSDVGGQLGSDEGTNPRAAGAPSSTGGPVGRDEEGSRQQVRQIDPVETALVEAIRGATAACQWDLLGKLAAELRERRLAAAPNVVDLDAARARRGA